MEEIISLDGFVEGADELDILLAGVNLYSEARVLNQEGKTKDSMEKFHKAAKLLDIASRNAENTNEKKGLLKTLYECYQSLTANALLRPNMLEALAYYTLRRDKALKALEELEGKKS